MSSIKSTCILLTLVGICLAEANYLPPFNGNGNGNGNTNGNGVYRNGNGNGVNGNGAYVNGNGVNGVFRNGNGNGGYTNGNGVNGNGNGNGVNGNGVYVNGNGVNGNGVYGNGVNGGYHNGNGVTVYANGIVDPFRALADAIGGGGVPGVDYPILAFVPDTGFSCNGQLPGYYADTSPEAGCQYFSNVEIYGKKLDPLSCSITI
ncbi:insoluble matrix shell protein 4-like [Penaeus indicus]|uniref:insoluble matrix shell protein 4-like n=1 Tax=Penaeus indicus TaxID=29960 RepID=UPI00300CA80C